MQYRSSTGYGTRSCSTSSAIVVTPPNAYGRLTVNGAGDAIEAYGHTTVNLQCGHLEVRPVTNLPPVS